MWDFEHPPLADQLAQRYQVDYMLPSECADRLATGQADIGLVPIASLATTPCLRVLPGCTIASKGRVRSLLLVRRARQPLSQIRTVAADTASRTTIAHTRILFYEWGNPAAEFIPMRADLDHMLDRADAAILIGDPALMALQERANRFERSGEELVFHDLAEEWGTLTGLPFVSAIWGIACSSPASGAAASSTVPSRLVASDERLEQIAQDLIASRDNGLANIPALVKEWSARLPLSAQTIQTYLTENIHYILDEDCIEGMRCFFRKAAEYGVLPAYELNTNL